MVFFSVCFFGGLRNIKGNAAALWRVAGVVIGAVRGLKQTDGQTLCGHRSQVGSHYSILSGHVINKTQEKLPGTLLFFCVNLKTKVEQSRGAAFLTPCLPLCLHRKGEKKSLMAIFDVLHFGLKNVDFQGKDEHQLLTPLKVCGCALFTLHKPQKFSVVPKPPTAGGPGLRGAGSGTLVLGSPLGEDELAPKSFL